MKTIVTLLAALVLGAGKLAAQTNSIPQDFLNLTGDVLNGPWGVATGYGHSISGGGNNVAFEIVTYDLVANVQNTGFSSGLIMGYDQLWSRNNSELNSISGGWQFSETGTPLAFTGVSWLKNITATVDLYQLVATPKAGNDVGSISGVSLSVDLYQLNNFHLKGVGLYENRNGQGNFNGNYLLAAVAVSHLF